jgi:N-acetyl sugar amidotransferase
MLRCRTCLYPNTKVDLHFDETGECSACRAYKSRPEIDWDASKQELLNLLDRHDGKCIVPSSGGKDSTAQVVMLKELGAEVTTVTAMTCHLTEIGRKNLDNLNRIAYQHREYTPNMTVRAKLNRLGLEMVGDISWPEHVGIFTTPFKAAIETGIPLLFYGENPQREYGGPMGSADAKEMTRRWVSEFGGFLGLRPQDLIGVEGLTERDMEPYMPPSAGQLLDIEAHFLGQYIPWDSHKNAKIAKAHGMIQQCPSSANWWDHENLDNAQTGIHDYMMWRKYGYGRACGQLSVDIRAGRITREQAMIELEKRDGKFPYVYAGVDVNDMLDRIGMNFLQLVEIMDRYTNKEIHARHAHHSDNTV